MLNNYKIAYLIATGLRYDDTYILQEIVKNHYKHEFLIIHSVFDPANKYEAYLEDIVLSHKDNIHQTGTWLSINETIYKAYQEGCDFAVFSHADTWVLKEDVITYWLTKLIQSEKIMVNTCSYKYKTLTTDFFLINIKKSVESGFFPHKFPYWAEVDEEMYHLMGGNEESVSKEVLNLKPRQLWMQDKSKFRNRTECIPLSLIGHHTPKPKKDRLKQFGIPISIGKFTKKLITNDMLGYYNKQHRKTYLPYV